MTKLPFPKSLPDFQRVFPDDAACAAYLEASRWADGFVCPTCKAKAEPFQERAPPRRAPEGVDARGIGLARVRRVR